TGFGPPPRLMSPLPPLTWKYSDRPSVSCLERVSGLGAPVQRDEEFLHVLVEPTLADLIGLGLDERVVASLGSGSNPHRAKRTDERARPRCIGCHGQAKLRKESVRREQHVGRRDARPMEEFHLMFASPVAGCTS